MELRLRDGDVVRTLSVEARHGSILFFDALEEGDEPGACECTKLGRDEAAWVRDAINEALNREPVGPMVRMMEKAA
jgi:hypothetical protein